MKFEYDGEEYGCTKEELIRLGRAFKPDIAHNTEALKIGAQQFKTSRSNLSQAFKTHKWARSNMLVAIAASQNDGVAQLQESGLKALREELQRMSHIVFSGRPGDRTYWSGRGADTIEVLMSRYNGSKPCLHGSDAHDLDAVGKPKLDRYCWLRGDLTFETLRQICFEPERRVLIGDEKPIGGLPSYLIKEVSIQGADWLKTPSIPINPGLVAVIGARGSGKTALVEMIAVGAGSVDSTHTKRSFLARAKEHLVDTESKLTWASEEETVSAAHVDKLSVETEDPRVRYLSQQFVDQLCSSDGLADDLVTEIERVIFEAHAPDERLGARTFEELRELKTASVQKSKERLHDQLREIGNDLSLQSDLKRSLENLKQKRGVEKAALDRLKNDRKKLIPTDNKALLDRLEEVRKAGEAKSRQITTHEQQLLKLTELWEEATQFRDEGAPLELNRLKSEYSDTALTETQWKTFTLKHEGDVDDLLDERSTTVQKDITSLKGPAKGETPEIEDSTKASAYFPGDADLSTLTYTLLLKEQRRLEDLIGVDKEKRTRYNNLSQTIITAEAALAQRDKEIQSAEAAPEKIKQLIKSRESTYGKLIGEIEREANVLKHLYQPLQDRLNLQGGTLGKLTFSVNRLVDIDGWGEAGERQIDKSRSGTFKGIGTLTQIIKDELELTWRNGSAKEIAEAMAAFRQTYGQHFWQHIFEDSNKSRESRKHWWYQVSEWLYSIDHVQVSYGLKYEGVDIQQLSPGTRGIVLLLLYLSIDIDDQRPLIIDQPEENLDPKSIYVEQVDCFKEAKTRRQIIMVTHNANLVVNTDADQVIIASRGEHKPKALPDIRYKSGGLENPTIREAVCDILEGGQQAFEERAKRLRIPLKA